ncbi:DUF1186 domain-containing protein [Endozoicomonas sp.]|uniref:DUF1186 domain-containing protein n=1 Tax=Endozoicomonas sp. TaxID=1892382 RepID=UPI0028863DF2|nr:DUF1186 domain-containing protein [Endozoicomonas sp.]
MTTEEILNELNLWEGYFPTAAVEAAIEQQQTITPHLLAHLQHLVDLGEEAREEEDDEHHGDQGLTMFTVYLLAQFREAGAYPLIYRLMSAWEGSAFFHLGDIVTEGLSRILASVCQGDTTLIKRLVESNGVNPYVRSAALHSLITLYSEQALSRDDLLSYFKSMFRLHPIREPNLIWNSLVICSEAMRFSELLPDIRQAYKEGLATNRFAALKDVEVEIETEYDDLRRLSYDKHYITDTIAELKGWAAFQEAYLKPADAPYDDDDYFHISAPVINQAAKVGRNEPCPCGSGKKFKKCCGR